MKATLTLLILSLIISISAIAQEDIQATKEKKFAISFVPQYAITGGMRIDFDFKLSKKTWLTLAPTLYYVNNSYMYGNDETSYSGVSLDLNYRYFPSEKGVYAAAGLLYKYLDIDYSEYNDDTRKMSDINTVGLNIMFGYQFILVEQLFLDIYLGWGFRYSIEDSKETANIWDDSILDLGYSGFLPIAGLRIGFSF
jgi:hypothetical protein